MTENKFYKGQGFECANEHPKLESEIAATILWKELSKHPRKPLIWNIFPFHPHKVDNERTNRTPNNLELEIGTTYLIEILKIYQIDKILALGRKAESKIKDLGYEYAYVGHPAQGGKNKFVIGLKAELK